VRPQQHSNFVRRALWGSAALAVVASIGGEASSSAPVDGATTVAAVSPLAVAAPAGADGIRAVDFGDVPQPGSACSEGLRATPPREIPVAAGSSRVLDLAKLTQLTVDPEVTYGDLDGDGAEEAVVHVTCAYGANGATDSIHVWTLRGDELVHLAGLSEPTDEAVAGALPSSLQDVAAADGGVTVTWTRYAPGDPNCCPSEQARLTYELDGDTLEPQGEAVTGTARP
jgi:hypothetical protein